MKMNTKANIMRSIRNCLNKQLTELCQHSLQLEEWSNKVALLLPQNLAKECRVGGFNKGCLVLTTTDSSWASLLRYAIPELIVEQTKKRSWNVSIVLNQSDMVEPIVNYEKPNLEITHTLSEKAKATIMSESQSCTYQPLKKALLHLAEGDA